MARCLLVVVVLFPVLSLIGCEGQQGKLMDANPSDIQDVDMQKGTWHAFNNKDHARTIGKVTASQPSTGAYFTMENVVTEDQASSVRKANVEQIDANTRQAAVWMMGISDIIKSSGAVYAQAQEAYAASHPQSTQPADNRLDKLERMLDMISKRLPTTLPAFP